MFIVEEEPIWEFPPVRDDFRALFISHRFRVAFVGA
jgi:hypothetical protein